MFLRFTALACAGLLVLSACGNTRGQRVATGAVGGAVAGQVLGDAPVAGAAIGAGVGALR